MKRKQLFDVVKSFKITGIISSILILPGLVSLVLALFGVTVFNFDIDFTGGTTMHINMERRVERADQTAIDDVVRSVIGVSASSIQTTGEGNGEVIIKIRELSGYERETLFAAIKERFNLSSDKNLLESDNVSAVVGKDLQQKAIVASLLAAGLILVYITVRFNLRSGLSAIIALTHDLLVILSAYVIFQIPMNLNFIAAMLTVLGYSINSTIIIFDRVRENMKLLSKQAFEDMVNISVWQTMARTINTSLTTLFPIVTILIFAVPVLRNFMIPLLVGICAGAYSSIFLSGPLWVAFRKLIPAK